MFNNFDNLFSNVLKKVITSIFKDAYTGGYFKVDDDRAFFDYVREHTKLAISYSTNYTNNNFPKLCSFSVVAYVGDKKVTDGGAAGHMSDVEMVKLRGKGEFLERLSSCFDLDQCSKNQYSPEKMAENYSAARKNIYVKSFLNFSWLSFKISDIFYSLKRYDNKVLNEKYILRPDYKKQSTTNGGAGHFDYNKAVLGGWLELIQRDSFLVYWLNSITPKKINIKDYVSKANKNTSDFNKLRNLINKLINYNLEFYFLDITSDLNVPSVCCVIKTLGEHGTVIGLGASSGFDADSNFLSALYESIGGSSNNYTSLPFLLDTDYIPFTKSNIGRNQRMATYTTDKMFQNFKFFIESSQEISVVDWVSSYKNNKAKQLENINPEKNHKASLEYLKELFKIKMRDDKNYNVYVYNIKNKILKHFDYKVVRVMCPALYSLYLNENYADPNHPRLKEFVKNKGLEKEVKLNIWPHPFP